MGTFRHFVLSVSFLLLPPAVIGAERPVDRASLRDAVNVRDFGAMGDGTTDDYAAIEKALSQAQANGRVVCFPPGRYRINKPLNMTVDGTILTACQPSTGYSYEPPAHDQTATIAAGAPMTNVVNFIPVETKKLVNYGAIRNLIVDGGGVASRCINVAGANLIQEVTATNCRDAGIRLGDFTNQTHLERVSAVGNRGGTGYGILATGIGTTGYSISNSNVRSNTIGLRLEAGVNVHVQNSVIESNYGVGLSLYRPDAGNVYNFLFDTVWFENNSRDTTGYNVHITSQTLSPATGVSFVRFNNSNVNATGSARHVHVESGRYVTFDRTSFLGGDQARAILLGPAASFTEFIDRNGGAITDNGNRNFTSGRETSGTKGWRLSGGITERGYSAAMGEWTTPPFSGRTYSASGSMSWAVSADDVETLQFMRSGKTMWVRWVLKSTNVRGAASNQLRIALPDGALSARKAVSSNCRQSNGAGEGACIVEVTPGAAQLNIYKNTYWSATNWATDGPTHIAGEISFEVQ